MPHCRLYYLYRLHRLVGVPAVCTLIAATGCDRKAPDARIDTTTQRTTTVPDSTSPPAASSGWNKAAGPVLLVQGETRDEAIVLLPEEGDSATSASVGTLAKDGARVSLFGRGGARLAGELGAAPSNADPECRLWPLRAVHGDGTADAWAVGFVGGQTAPLALDSVIVLSVRDSTALVAETSRLASLVTALTDASFQGLRFTAHDIRRFEAAPGVQAIVAHLVRKVNQEANPQEEQTLLIAERDSGLTTGPYQLVYAERVHGLEEQSTMPEVIAGVRIAGRPTLIVARDSDAGVAYAMLERTGPRRWRIRWTSGMTRCG